MLGWNSINPTYHALHIQNSGLKMHFEWDERRNKQLKTNRAVCFEDVFIAISEDRLLDILPHHNPVKYPNQKLFIVQIRGYVYYVPFVEDEETIFLKNIIPSRKYQKKYLEGAKHDS